MDKALGLTNTQKKIIDAAIKVFSEKGFEGATTSEIAQEAGVAEGTIFRYSGKLTALSLISLRKPTSKPPL